MNDVYEIINPSDAYTIRGPEKVCIAAVLALGNGAYGLGDREGGAVLSVLLFGGLEEFLTTRFPESFDDYFEGHAAEVAECLDSVLIGGFADRVLYEEATGRMKESQVAGYRDKWQDTKRTSLNDIGANAKTLAARLRETCGVPTS